MSDLPQAVTSTDMRLDLVIDELRSLRAALVPPVVNATEPKDGDTIELREPHTVDPTLMTADKPRRKR